MEIEAAEADAAPVPIGLIQSAIGGSQIEACLGLGRIVALH
jgi:hypothetical protein